LTSITVELVTKSEEITRFNEYVDRHHYLGYRRPIGNHLPNFIIGRDAQGEHLLVCLLFAFAVYKLECRHQWIGWCDKQREKHLPLVINNTRFLIFPWVQIKNLASEALSLATKQAANDWLEQHGLHPLLVETFVDTGCFTGAYYKVVNWSHIGESLGKKGSKNVAQKNPKVVFVYPLHDDCQTILTQNKAWMKPTKRGKNRLAKQRAATITKLIEYDPFVVLYQSVIVLLSSVAEEFDAQWQQRRHTINSLLLVLFIFRQHARCAYEKEVEYL
jgi:hypothetical protein